MKIKEAAVTTRIRAKDLLYQMAMIPGIQIVYLDEFPEIGTTGTYVVGFTSDAVAQEKLTISIKKSARLCDNVYFL